MKDFVINVSWPPKQLSPNGRYHWAQVARCSKKARSEARLMMWAELQRRNLLVIDPKKITKVGISYLFVPPDRRARDDDNLIRAMKPYRDGIAEALGVDDKIFRTQESDFGKPMRPAYVVIHVQVHEEGDDGV